MARIFTPKILSLMPTWQCTASCRDCGTFSSPGVEIRLELIDMFAAIDRAKDAGFDFVVFTGGEATLCWPSLIDSIRHATSLGLPTRLVTNAWWAKSEQLARQKLQELRESGLVEINFSTGDEHARFVSVSNIVLAITYAIEVGFEPHVMIEVRSGASITKKSIVDSHDYKVMLGELASMVSFTESPWMPINPDEVASYPEGYMANKNNLGQKVGCDSLFGTLTLQANGEIAACCGLGMQKIKSLNLGKFDRTSTSFENLTMDAESDLTKLLIKQFGPEKLLAKVEKINPTIQWEDKYAHKCQACVRIFSDPKIINTILSNEDELLYDLAASIAIEKILIHKIT